MDIDLNVRIERQPDYTTCGPTALHAIYGYYGDPIDLDTVIAETPKLPGGGTLGFLGIGWPPLLGLAGKSRSPMFSVSDNSTAPNAGIQSWFRIFTEGTFCRAMVASIPAAAIGASAVA